MTTRPLRRRRSAIPVQPPRPPAPPASGVKATPLSSKTDSVLVYVGSAALWGVGIKLLWQR